MRKSNLTILTLCLFFYGQIHAASIDIEKARQKAAQFMTKQSANADGRRMNPSRTPRMELAYQHTTAEGLPTFYVFNGEAGGFVIVSSDDQTESILGYADSGAFSMDDCPANMRKWLEGYACEIERQSKVSSTVWMSGNTPENVMTASRKSIQPLMTSTWNQFAPYNLKCPVISGSRAPTGCSATAIAQILYFHKWPKDYIDKFDELPSVKFDWNNMKDSYDSNSTSLQENAVADLMLYCGHACSVRYGESSSGSSDYYYPEAFTRLGFPKTPVWRSRSSYPDDLWEDLIYNELVNNRPVLYSAAQKYEGERTGHAFVCDGYDQGMFHINWGWGGLGNGYFRLQALNPYKDAGYSLGYGGFSLNQVAIIGICPEEIDDTDNFSCLNVGWLYLDGISSGSYDETKGLADFRVCYRFGYTATYYRYYGGQYDAGLGLFNNDRLIDVKSIEEAFESVWSYSWYNLDGLGKNLSDGIYQLKGVGRKHGTTQWTKNINADNNSVSFEIKDGKVTASSVSKGTDLFRFVNMEQVFRDDELQGIKVLRMTFRNENEVEDSPQLYLYVDGKETNCEQVYTTVGKTDYVDFVFEADKGYHKVLVTSDEYDTSKHNVFYMNNRFYLRDSSGDAIPLLGDVNSDNGVDETDVRLTIMHLLNLHPDNLNAEYADVNADDKIDITDVVGIVDITLGKPPAVSSVIRVAPVDLDFGEVKYGTSQTKRVAVSNTGDEGITYHISGGGPFHVTANNQTFTLSPEEKHYFDVTYTPQSATSQDDGVINISSNATNGPQYIHLKGKGCENRDICVEPKTVDFGIVVEGTVETEHFTVSNVGKAPLSFYIDFNSYDIFEIDETNKNFMLQPGEFKVFTVRCNGIRAPNCGAGAAVYIKSDATNADEYSCINLSMDGGDPYPVAQAIDLGLPSGTKWASWNIGAFKPEDDGILFAWGETEICGFYWWSDYSHCDGSESSCHDLGDCISGTEYDVAHEKWGGAWQIPSVEQVDELLANCSARWTIVNDVYGIQFTGPNGNNIFLPAGGDGWGSENRYHGSRGLYWTGSVYLNYRSYAYGLYFEDGDAHRGQSRRYYGQSIRPVTK